MKDNKFVSKIYEDALKDQKFKKQKIYLYYIDRLICPVKSFLSAHT